MAAGKTYTPIATTTLGSAQGTVTFNSFSGYTDLIIVSNFATNLNNTYGVYIQLNGDSGNNYSSTRLQGNGTTATSARQSNTAGIRFMMDDKTSSTQSNMFVLNVFNYSNSTTYKTVLVRSGTANYVADATVGLWRNTNAITSIDIGGDGGQTFSAGSTFTLYGILAA